MNESGIIVNTTFIHYHYPQHERFHVMSERHYCTIKYNDKTQCSRHSFMLWQKMLHSLTLTHFYWGRNTFHFVTYSTYRHIHRHITSTFFFLLLLYFSLNLVIYESVSVCWFQHATFYFLHFFYPPYTTLFACTYRMCVHWWW